MTNIFPGPYTPPFYPIATVTPFTYKDGLTYLEVLEGLRHYVNTDLTGWVNDNFGELAASFVTEVNRMIDEVTAITEGIEQGVVSDSAVAALVNNVASLTRVALDELYANLAAEPTDEQIAAIVVAGDTKAALDAAYAGQELTNSEVAAYVTGAGATKTALDSAYAGQELTNSEVAAYVTGAGATKTALDSAYGGKVAQTSTGARIYGTDTGGNQAQLAYSSASATANTVVQRNASGQIVTATPTGSTQAATKGYVDNLVIDDTDVAGYVDDTGSLTRASLDTLYAGGGGLDDTGIAALVEDDESDTRVALDDVYPKNISSFPITQRIIGAPLADPTTSPTAVGNTYLTVANDFITAKAVGNVMMDADNGTNYGRVLIDLDEGHTQISSNGNRLTIDSIVFSNTDVLVGSAFAAPVDNNDILRVGVSMFDTTLSKPIWLKTVDSEDAALNEWVDATGTTVYPTP